MANPLQPKCIRILEQEFNAYVVNLVAGSKSGDTDLIACIEGLYYGFEIKWAKDTPSEIQKKKINKVIDAGGRAYFIRSEEQLRYILSHKLPPKKYDAKSKFIL